MRFWEVDFARGIAIVLMVVFNWSFSLKFLGVYTLNLGDFYWAVFPMLIGGSFIFLSGVSRFLLYKKISDWPENKIYKKLIFSGLKIFLLGIGITIVTWLAFPHETVFFGILHLIGLSWVLSAVFLRFKDKRLKIVLGVLFLVAGFWLQTFSFNFNSLLWLGFNPSNFQSFDYWPLLPWFGVFLIGMHAGDVLFYWGKNPGTAWEPNIWPIKQICFLGRKSLVIYLSHQPILLVFLYFLGFPIFAG